MRPIPGHEGYFASSDGRIYSRRTAGTVLKELAHARRSSNRRYHYVSLGKRFSSGVHQLVALTFHGPAPVSNERIVVRHRDNNPSNNRADNLQWGTQAQNLNDRREHGTMTWGERNGQAKLTEQQVVEIRRRRAAGEKCRVLAAEFNITYQAIHKVGSGLRWKTVGEPIAPRQRKPRKAG